MAVSLRTDKQLVPEGSLEQNYEQQYFLVAESIQKAIEFTLFPDIKVIKRQKKKSPTSSKNISQVLSYLRGCQSVVLWRLRSFPNLQDLTLRNCVMRQLFNHCPIDQRGTSFLSLLKTCGVYAEVNHLKSYHIKIIRGNFLDHFQVELSLPRILTVTKQMIKNSSSVPVAKQSALSTHLPDDESVPNLMAVFPSEIPDLGKDLFAQEA